VIVVQRTQERRNNLLKELPFKHRMFWLASETGYKADIGAEIFKTPRDFAERSYGLLNV
jgi:hypothetical protein